MKIKNIRIKKYSCFVILIFTILILLGISSCVDSSNTELDSKLIGKWKLLESIPEPVMEGVDVYINISEDGKVIIDFDVAPEYHDFFHEIDFLLENLHITGTCGTRNGYIRITVDGDNAINELTDSRFFNREIVYIIEDDILTLNIDNIYKEIYQKTAN